MIRPLTMGGMSDLYVISSSQQKRFVYRRLKEQYRKHRRIRQQVIKGAEVLSRLDHPGIIKFEAAAIDSNNLPYLILEYFEGENLRKLIHSEKEQLLKHRLTILRKIAKSIAYIHDEGYFHFDIKPENLLINKQGDTRVIDFDLVFEKQKKPVKIREISGTAAYIAPEVLKFNQADETTDIFGYGVSAFEMITGRKPPPLVLPQPDQPLNTKALDELSRHCPPALAKVVFKCLDPDPKARYPSMHLAIQDLDNII